MQKTHRISLIAGALSVALLAAPAVDAKAAKIVVHGKFKHFSGGKVSITFTSSKGTYTAKYVGPKKYSLHGKINGKRFTGTIRTHQDASLTRYIANGSGKLGGKHVRISGGGPNSFKTATLVL